HHIFHNKNENKSLCNICNSVKNRTELSAYELEFSETTWFDISISPIDGEESLIEVIRNITEKKQTANALKKSEAQLRTLIESLPDLIWLKDSNGVYLSCNLKFEKLYGAKEADILGKTDYDFVDRDLADFFRKNDRLAMAAGKPTTNEEELTYASDGHTEFLETIKTPMRDSNGDLIGVLGIARDISERKKMENALLESENNLVRGQEIAKLGNWKLIPETGEISGSNELLNIYGITHNELTLENITSLAHPDDRNYDLVHIKNGIEHGVPWDIEHRILLKDGSVKWIHAVGEPLQDNNKKTVSIIGIVQDITERKLADEVLRRSQKMDALGKLTGGIAHDFNNMLGVVLGYSELLIEMLDDNPKLLTYANEIHRAGERGAKLTQKLLSSSRQKASSSEQINFNALLQDGTHMLEKTLTARIHLTLELEKNLWATWLDASDFEDAVLNLSINAMHAISDNGELTFRTSNKFINENTARSLHLSPGEYACLSVIDTGCGIDEATTERIFEPFFTTKDNLLSSGLGLAQVYGFVERSGGAISVNSQPGQGTQFDLYFPRYQTTEPTTTDTKTST
ncbi:MAG: PAS domain S-box protein, partial [Gammaproteobacteria bacterium]|nr:PAS domain S-box protein [Gammaproteobacteria bacterium]